jgi:hypothetical protein
MTERRLTKVYEDSRSIGRCRYCSKPIAWYRSVGMSRNVPFDIDAVTLKTEYDEDRRMIAFLDASDSHFETCEKSPDRN